jgi:putative intracellular protease/amidase
MADKAQWLLEDALKEKIGVKYSKRGTWEPYKLEDRNLITGQNPQSAIVLAERLLEIFGSR